MRFFILALFCALLGPASAASAQVGATRAGAAPRRAGTTTTTAAKPTFIKEFGTMWTFDAPPLEYWRTTYNFSPDAAWLDHVRQSAVRIPGCSASFVSATGLVMTNHHCGRSCTASASPRDTNYVQAGFAARNTSDEKRCEGMWADRLESIQDVTDRVHAAMTATASARRVEQRTAEIARVEQECTQQTQLLCQVVTFYQGGKYSLYRYKHFTDVRLVMAPEENIAFYGGDPDNFTYPRYDLDLTLLRVYENGQPVRPNDYLKWSASGAGENELVFVVGNPGSTGRILTMSQMEYLRDVDYPSRLAGYDRLLTILRARSAASPEAARQYENTIFSLANSKKAVTGYRVGLVDSAIMAKKLAFERDFRARVTRDARLNAQYGNTWAEIERSERELKALSTQLQWNSFGGGSSLLNIAGGLVRVPLQSSLADSMRLAQYRGPGLQRIRQQVLTTPIDTAFERMALAATFAAWKEALPANDPLLIAALGSRDGDPAAAAARLVSQTTLADTAARRALLAGGSAAINASRDPLIVLARQIEPVNRRLVMRAAQLDAVASANAEKLGRATFDAYGTSLPPDATFTLRISDGVVKGFPYNGTTAPYKTTFFGLYDRAASFDNKDPFKLPARWAAGRDRLDLSTPFDFVSTNDIIGGNSGSPVINRNAEVVGLIFDGNIESLPNRFIFTDDVARSVSVHSRAITEALRKLYDATWIADELEGRVASRD
ncbi:MAG TPA: S46 family peptidase [Gemmatimonadaceae bacterium]|nr:S46 family peptidase [Gemmatimonadaceae bacterium]